MSERTYFSIRLTVPGYTLLLWILLINLGPFISFVQNNNFQNNNTALFGILLSFITLISGPLLGFLVSQPWYLILLRVSREYEILGNTMFPVNIG